jgi:hypothetical protein
MAYGRHFVHRQRTARLGSLQHHIGLALGDGTVQRLGGYAASTSDGGVVQIRVTRETWNPLVGAALATFGVTHKPPVLNHALATRPSQST